MKLESSTSQRKAHITYKIDSGADVIPFKNYKMLFQDSTIEALCAIKNLIRVKRIQQV